MTGNVGNVTGNVGNVTGNVGNVTGNVGNVTGNVGNVTGNVGKVVGNVGSVTGNVGSVIGSVGKVIGSVGSGVPGGADDAANVLPGPATSAFRSDVSPPQPLNFGIVNLPRNFESPPMCCVPRIVTVMGVAVTQLLPTKLTGGVPEGSVGSVIGRVGNVTGRVGNVMGRVGTVIGSVGSVTEGSACGVAAGAAPAYRAYDAHHEGRRRGHLIVRRVHLTGDGLDLREGRRRTGQTCELVRERHGRQLDVALELSGHQVDPADERARGRSDRLLELGYASRRLEVVLERVHRMAGRESRSRPLEHHQRRRHQYRQRDGGDREPALRAFQHRCPPSANR